MGRAEAVGDAVLPGVAGLGSSDVVDDLGEAPQHRGLGARGSHRLDVEQGLARDGGGAAVGAPRLAGVAHDQLEDEGHGDHEDGDHGDHGEAQAPARAHREAEAEEERAGRGDRAAEAEARDAGDELGLLGEGPRQRPAAVVRGVEEADLHPHERREVARPRDGRHLLLDVAI